MKFHLNSFYQLNVIQSKIKSVDYSTDKIRLQNNTNNLLKIKLFSQSKIGTVISYESKTKEVIKHHLNTAILKILGVIKFE